MDTTKLLVKPFLRGRFHEASAFFVLGAGLMLVFRSHSSRELFAALVYALTLFALFGISALYHRIHWQPKARAWMRRLDHAAIFLSIAGTSTAVYLLALPESTYRVALTVVWIAALLGILQVLFWIKAPKWLATCIYVAMGATALPFLPALSEVLSVSSTTLIILGLVVYSIGALVYAVKRPNPWPRVFGYHEIFHIAVMVAAALHFIVVYNLMG